MLKILLVGDTQITDDDFYHVGDEAAFNEVSRRLKEDVSDVRLSKLASTLPSADEALGWITDIDRLARFPGKLGTALAGFDIVWFVGSGNLNSLFPAYLYQRVALMLTAKSMGITTIATSQTIGPFYEGDTEIFDLGIRHINYISVRDKINSATELDRLNVAYHITPDDATDLHCERKERSRNVQIGISLRDWDTIRVVERTTRITQSIGGYFEIHLIPHIIDQQDSLDVGFMKQHLQGNLYNYEYFRRSKARFDIEVKSLTAMMDVVITSRYHGAVFSTSEKVKTIALFENPYYQQKMEGLLSLGVTDLLVLDAREDLDGELISNFLEKVPDKESPTMRLTNMRKIISEAQNKA